MELTPDFITLGLIWYIVFLFSTTCHEASHALAAKLGGDPTASLGGQVTLNPLPHMRREPFGMALVPILSYVLGGWMIGWASAPYDPNWQLRHPRRAAWMSLAGPGANFVLMFLAAVGIWAGLLLGVFQAPASVGYAHITEAVVDSSLVAFAAKFLSVLLFQNLLLGTFNLLPIPPLDGSTGIAVLMPESMARSFLRFVSNPTFSMLGIIVGWRVFDQIFDPIFTIALSLLYPGVGYR